MVRTSLAVALVLVAAGCGGGSHSSSAVGARTPATVSSSASSSSAPAAPAAGPSPSTTKASAPAPQVDKSRSSGPATVAPAPAAAGPANRPGSGAPLPAAAGTYRYRQSGQASAGGSSQPVPPEGTLTIDPAGADGTQVSHRRIDPNQDPSDTTVSYRAGGIYLDQVVMRSGSAGRQATFTCTFTPPLATPPWPLATGKTFSGHADCGQFTLDVRGQVGATHAVAIDGTTRHPYVLQSQLTFHGQLEGSGTQTDWFDPSDSLILHEESSLDGTYANVVKFTAQSTSDLLSTHPA